MRLPFLAFVLSGLVATSAQGATVEELIAKNVAARGGAERIGAIKTLKLVGHLRYANRFGSFDLGYARYIKAPNAVRIEESMQGLTQVMAWDGTQAWRISPFQGRKDPERLSADDAKELADDAWIGGALFDYRAKGIAVEYLGTEDVDGTEAHKLKLTLPNGDSEDVFLDPDHDLEIRTVFHRKIRGTETTETVDYSDYELVAGVYFPFAIISRNPADGSESQITIDHAEANAPVDEALFAFPATGATP
jgi:hypothetical protein